MRIHRSLLVSCVVFVALLTGALQASAHATPISYEPEAESVLEVAPQVVRIIFSERVEPKASSITIFDPTGKTVNQSSGILDPLDSHVFWTSISSSDQGSPSEASAKEGSYAVSWQVVSADDGHFSKGAFVFSVGKAVPNPTINNQDKQSEIVYRSPMSEAFFIGLELLGQAILWSLLLLLPVLHRRLSSDILCKCKVGRFVLLGILCVVLGTAGYIALQSQTLSAVQNTDFIQGIRTFIQTRSGSYTAFRGLLGVTFGLVFLAVGKKMHSQSFNKNYFLLTLAILLAGYLRARISHAAASSVVPEFSIFVNFIHLIAKQLWIGGAVLMAIWILPLLKNSGSNQVWRESGKAFSRLAAVAVGIGGISGAYIIWLHLKGFGNILTTDWGLRFIFLSSLAGLFFTIRLYQEYRLGRLPDNSYTFPKLLRVFRLEAILGVAVLFTSSLLIITTPPLSSGQAFMKILQTPEGEIRLLDAPDGAPIFLLELSTSGGIRKLIITGTNTEKGIGPLVIPTTFHHPGTYAFEKKHLTPAGNWKIDITAQRTSGYDLVGSFTFDYPTDITAIRQKLAEKSSGPFDGLVLLSVVALAFISRRIYKDAK